MGSDSGGAGPLEELGDDADVLGSRWAQAFVGARLGRRPEAAGARREGGARQRQSSRWRLLTVSSCILSGALLLVQPALGLVAAVVALYCLQATRVSGTAG